MRQGRGASRAVGQGSVWASRGALLSASIDSCSCTCGPLPTSMALRCTALRIAVIVNTSCIPPVALCVFFNIDINDPQVALYFAFIAFYTRWMIFPAFAGSTSPFCPLPSLLSLLHSIHDSPVLPVDVYLPLIAWMRTTQHVR